MLTLETRARARRKRQDKKRREALPLWATNETLLDQVAPLAEVPEIERQLLAMDTQSRASDLRRWAHNLRTWADHRALCAQYITPDQVKAIEDYARRAYPSDYRASLWVNLAIALGLRCQCDSCRRWWELYDAGVFSQSNVAVSSIRGLS